MRLPNNRLIVGGVDLSTRFGIIMTDDYTLNPPEVNTFLVDVPGRIGGPIDLTDSLVGDASYSTREQEFVFAVIDDMDFEATKTNVSNFLHGRDFDYRISFDPGYTYHGRFFVDEYYSKYRVGYIKINVTANPFKSRGARIYKVNAIGGKTYVFECGRKAQHPVVQTSNPTTIANGDVVTEVGVGTFRLNDILLEAGYNELFINSYKLLHTKWEDLGEGAEHEMTWGDAGEMRWATLHRLGIDGDMVFQSWEDMCRTEWGSLSEKTWSDLNYKPDTGESALYLTYEWEDL